MNKKRKNQIQTQTTTVFREIENFEKQMEEGLYGEKLIVPQTIRYGYNAEEDFEYVVLTDENGEETIITRKPAINILGYYFKGQLKKRGISLKEFYNKTCEERTTIINELLKETPRAFKLQLDPETEEVLFVRSDKFQQVSWKQVFKTVTEAIAEAFNNKIDEFIARTNNAWNFKMPVKGDLLDFYVEVYAGSNIGYAARKSLTITVRAKTIVPLKGMESPCFNWCSFAPAARWFEFETKTIFQEFPQIPKLHTRVIHLSGAEMQKLSKEDLVNAFKEQKTSIEQLMPKLAEIVHTKLTMEDVQGIVSAYQYKYNLPKYVVEDLYSLIKEMSIWGLSNAFSFFRTHCEYKRTKKPREEASLTRVLEKIAGELIVLSPLIKNLKEKYGKIEKELLLDPKTYEEMHSQ